MDMNKLASLSESMMLGSDDAGEIGDGAIGIVSYIKRIESFTKGTDTDSRGTESKGEILTSVRREEICGCTDEEKQMISLSKRKKDGFVVIPKVV